MKIAIHATWPLGMDYPLFRWYMEKLPSILQPHETSFYISFVNNHSGQDISDWVKSWLSTKKALYFDTPARVGAEDWRNKAIHAAYSHIVGDYVLFTEQDFFMTVNAWKKVINHIQNKKDVLAYIISERVHPAFILIPKNICDRVKKDFSPIPDKKDHFYKFTEDVKSYQPFISLSDLGLKENIDFLHMSGLTHNYDRVRQGLYPTRIEDFHSYNMICLQLLKNSPSPFISTVQNVLDKVPMSNEFSNFFTSLIIEYGFFM